MEDNELLLTEEMRHWCPDCLQEVMGEPAVRILEQCVGRIPEQHLWLILDAARMGHMEGRRSVSNPD